VKKLLLIVTIVSYFGFPFFLNAQVDFLDSTNNYSSCKGVGADGVSSVILKILTEKIPSPYQPRVALSDYKISIQGEGNGVVYSSGGELRYGPPKYFVRSGHPEDIYQGEREIHFGIQVQLLEWWYDENGYHDQKTWYPLTHPKFLLIRPPVILLHGLWSDPEKSKLVNFRDSLKNNGYRYVLAYQYPNSVGFDENTHVIVQCWDTVWKQARADGFHCTKADVVAHSMGGMITKLGNDGNVEPLAHILNSITTIGTPHDGSPWADILWKLANKPILGKCVVIPFFASKNRPLMDGAIHDLQTSEAEGGIHCPANNIKVPICVIVGINSSTDLLSDPLFISVVRICKFEGTFELGMSLLEAHSRIFGVGERSDFVVGESSQKGGVTTAKVFSSISLHHLSETSNEKILQAVTDFLNRTSDAPVGTYKIAKKDFSHFPSLNIPDCGISSGEIHLVSPQNGQIFSPGEVVQVKIEVTNPKALVLIGASTGESELLQQSPYEWQFKIPQNIVGPLKILVFARDGQGFIGSDEVTIQATSRASLTDVAIYPNENPLYLVEGMKIPLLVYGVYSDGVTRDIVISKDTILFSSSNLDVIEVSSAGIITAKSKGNATLKIDVLGITKEIPVICR
jgi:hypothetical protein